jgi:hypothetical protein
MLNTFVRMSHGLHFKNNVNLCNIQCNSSNKWFHLFVILQENHQTKSLNLTPCQQAY